MSDTSEEVHKAWITVRKHVIETITRDLEGQEERSIWNVEGMDRGDVSEFDAMMMNLEDVIGLPESDRWDWDGRLTDAEQGDDNGDKS